MYFSSSEENRLNKKPKRALSLKRKEAMKRICFILCTVVIFSLTTGFLATQGVTLVVKKTVEDLTYEADSILIGKVKEMESQWNSERTLIYTYVAVCVTEYVKRIPEMKEPKQIIVKVLGGEVGDIALKASDTPEFTEGEELFLFLRLEELPVFRVAGLFQGKYTIEDGKVKNKVLEREIPLDSFIGQIKELTKEAKGSQ